MSLNQTKLIEQYTSGNEEARAVSSRTAGLEFYYTKKHLGGMIGKNDRVLEISCATGYYGLYYAEQCREYVGIDIVPKHIGLFREKIAARGLKNVSCQVGDGTDLKGIEDESFDVVLCLGPMYHLTEQERERVFEECARVCRRGGTAAFAYINRIGVYAGGCILDSRYPNERANRCVLENGTDDMRPELFFYTTPEEMERRAAAHGLKKLKNLGTDFFVTMGIVDSMDEEKFELMKPLYDEMTSHESCTGMANHALLICAK